MKTSLTVSLACLALLAVLHDIAIAAPPIADFIRIEYDAEHRPLRVEIPDFVSKYERNEANGRLERYLQTQVSDNRLVRNISFTYNQNGCLSGVTDSDTEDFRLERNENCLLVGVVSKEIEVKIHFPYANDITVESIGIGSIKYHFDPDDDVPVKEKIGDTERLYELIDPVLRGLDDVTAVSGLDWQTGREECD